MSVRYREHAMKMIKLGNGGLTVPAIGLGCMGMSAFYGPTDETEALATLDRALELGCNFWDTSDIYGPHTNEELLGKSLRGRRDSVVLATKFGIVVKDGQVAGLDGSPEYLKRCCDESLRRLQTDHIDLYYQHRVDPGVPVEETVGALADLVQAGKIRFIGLSEASSEQLRRAHAEHPVSALQTEYSLWSRDVEPEILPTCRELGIGFVGYSPLGRGFLTGALTTLDDLAEDDWRRNNPRFTEQAFTKNAALVEAVEGIASGAGVKAGQVALAWLLHKGDDICLIPGTKRIRYLEENCAAEDIELSDSEMAQLDALSELFEIEGARYG
jgi:aryl-alcohol dehydrogenase-like predicted oxidoreductase